MICAAACLLVTVTLVWDGDTFRQADGPRIRLWGLDAPELDAPGGPEARDALDRIIHGQPLTCAMIRGGWGVEAVKFSKGVYRGCRG